MKTKNYISFLFAFVAFATLFSCTKSKRQYVEAGEKMVETKLNKYKVFEHNKFNYSFYVPVNWQFQKRKDNTVIIHNLLENEDDKYMETLDVVVLEAGFKNPKEGKVKNKYPLEDLYKDQIKVLTGNEYNLKIEQEGEKILNGQKSKWASFYDNKNNRDLRAIKYFLSKDDLAFIITATTQNEEFHKFGPIINEIIESFTLN